MEFKPSHRADDSAPAPLVKWMGCAHQAETVSAPSNQDQNMWWEMDGRYIPSLTGRTGSSSWATWSTCLTVWRCLEFRPLGWKDLKSSHRRES